MKEIVEDGAGGQWAFDAQRMAGLLRSAAYMQATVSNSSVAKSRDHWLQKIHLAPETAEVISNLKQVQTEQARLLDQYRTTVSQMKAGGWEDLEAFLAQKKAELEANKAKSQAMFRSAQQVNDMAIKSAETGIKVAKTVRDGSIVGLGIIATVSTGGLTLALATTAQAGLQGVATYQDTGDATKAIASGAFVAIPIGAGQAMKSLTVAGQASKTLATSATLVVDASADVANQVVVEDKAIEDAILAALAKQGLGQLQKAATKDLATELGKTIRDSVKIMNDHSGSGSNRATPLLIETAKKLGEAAGKATAGKPASASPAPGVPSPFPNMAMAPGSSPPSTAKMWVNTHILSRVK